MGALTPAAFAALLATCAPGAPPNYLTGIAKTESGFQPFAIHDNTDKQTVYPETHGQAVSIAKERLRLGHSIDVGLLQVNASNWEWLGLTAETALNPCPNIAAGSAAFQAFSRYNTGSDQRGWARGYVQRVVANLHGSAWPVDQVAERAEPPVKNIIVDDPNDPRPPDWDLVGVAEWEDRHKDNHIQMPEQGPEEAPESEAPIVLQRTEVAILQRTEIRTQ
jgi:type IV secretion system protein VirB1